jgi:hypothetical protein
MGEQNQDQTLVCKSHNAYSFALATTMYLAWVLERAPINCSWIANGTTDMLKQVSKDGLLIINVFTPIKITPFNEGC